MKKRRRGKVILDSIDGKILSELRKRPRAVMELTKILKIKHPSLKSHLSRLSQKKLIKRTSVPRSRKIILSLPKNKNWKSIFDLFK